MYPVILGLHNLNRWVVVVVGLWAVIRFWRGWMRRSVWTAADAQAMRFFVIALDVQMLLGFLLYAVFSPLTRQAFGDMGAAMRDPAVRYFVADHMVIMVLAIAFAHIATVRVRKAASDSARFQTAAIWFGVVLAAILGFIPWARPLVPSF
jgi:hypothetical protein